MHFTCLFNMYVRMYEYRIYEYTYEYNIVVIAIVVAVVVAVVVAFLLIISFNCVFFLSDFNFDFLTVINNRASAHTQTHIHTT